MENLGEGNVDEETGAAMDAGGDGNEQRDGTPRCYPPVLWVIGIVLALAQIGGLVYVKHAVREAGMNKVRTEAFTAAFGESLAEEPRLSSFALPPDNQFGWVTGQPAGQAAESLALDPRRTAILVFDPPALLVDGSSFTYDLAAAAVVAPEGASAPAGREAGEIVTLTGTQIGEWVDNDPLGESIGLDPALVDNLVYDPPLEVRGGGVRVAALALGQGKSHDQAAGPQFPDSANPNGGMMVFTLPPDEDIRWVSNEQVAESFRLQPLFGASGADSQPTATLVFDPPIEPEGSGSLGLDLAVVTITVQDAEGLRPNLGPDYVVGLQWTGGETLNWVNNDPMEELIGLDSPRTASLVFDPPGRLSDGRGVAAMTLVAPPGMP